MPVPIARRNPSAAAAHREVVHARPESAAFGAVASLLFLETLTGGPPRAEATPATTANLRPAAAVAWPPSTGLLLAEVVTGGAPASDEYVEITNAGPVPADLVRVRIARRLAEIGAPAAPDLASPATLTRRVAGAPGDIGTGSAGSVPESPDFVRESA